MILTDSSRVQNLCRTKENQAQGRNRLAHDHRPECNQIKTQPWSPDFLSHNILSQVGVSREMMSNLKSLIYLHQRK